jgi:c-di-GMP-binding flagellar brake protein YcgR
MKQGTQVDVRDKSGFTPYITTVESVMDDERILLNIIRMGGNETRLSVGKTYTLHFFSPEGVYKYEADLRGYMQVDSNDYMFFQTIGDGERIQRRESFRLICNEEIAFYVVENSDEEPKISKGFIRDMSCGGICLLTEDELSASKLLNVKLPMIEPDFELYAAILSKKAVSEEKFKWQYGIEFIGSTDSNTEKMESYVASQK